MGITLSERAAPKVAETVRRVLGKGQALTHAAGPSRARGIFFDAKLTADLAAGSLTSPTTATFEFWAPVTAGDAQPYVATGETSTLVNRSVSLTGVSGTAILVTRVKDEWRVVWADCGV